MASQPRIDRPCPLRFGALPQPGVDFCTRCSRQVHNFDRLDAAARVAFLSSCAGPVCVAYTVRRARPLAALVAAASLAGAGTGMAQSMDVDALPHSPVAGAGTAVSLPGVEGEEGTLCDDLYDEIMVGGVSKPGALDMVEVDDGLPALPEIAEQDLLEEVDRPTATFEVPPSR